MTETTKWTVNEIAKAVGGEVNQEELGEVEVSSVHFDTRLLEPGAIFVPLKAERDGHDFIEQAIENQAVAAFWELKTEGAPEDFPIIFVRDTADAMNKFAQYHLQNTKAKVVAITGSNGKTTTKDLTASVLAQHYDVHKTEGNFNNEIGVPMTILSMPSHTEIVVLEMGMDRPGEIEVLSGLFRPDVGVVTMIGESHLEFFGSRENIAKNKMGIAKGIRPYGILLYLEDEPLLKALAPEVPNTITQRTFGFSKEATFTADQIEEGIYETTFHVNNSPETEEWTIPVPGSYNVSNALAAIGVGRSFGLDWSEIKRGLAEAELTSNRLEWLDGWSGSKVLNDAYNASPTSMISSLNYFAHLEEDRNKVVVIGDMRELGQQSEQMHAQLQEAVDFSSFDKVYLYGHEMHALKNALAENLPDLEVVYFEDDKKQLLDDLKNSLTDTDMVLVKSSLGTGLIEVAKELGVNKEDSE